IRSGAPSSPSGCMDRPCSDRMSFRLGSTDAWQRVRIEAVGLPPRGTGNMEVGHVEEAFGYAPGAVRARGRRRWVRGGTGAARAQHAGVGRRGEAGVGRRLQLSVWDVPLDRDLLFPRGW